MTYDGFIEAGPPYWSDAYMEKKASEKSCIVERPLGNELFLDVDSDSDFDQVFLPQLEVLKSTHFCAVLSWDVRRSGSGNKHIRVRLDREVTPDERILLQAVLGSDRKRELLSYVGLLRGQASPTVFFRPKEQES